MYRVCGTQGERRILCERRKGKKEIEGHYGYRRMGGFKKMKVVGGRKKVVESL